MRHAFLALILAVFSIGCSKQIEDFVKVPRPPTGSGSTSTPIGMKVSGGAQHASGAQVDTNYSIGYKDREMKGATWKAKISISQNRPTY